MSTLRAAFAVLLLLASVGACTTNRAGAEGPQAKSETSTLQVSNNNWLDVTIYAVRGSHQVRMGTVTSMGSTVFRLPPTVVRAGGMLRLRVDPIGSRHTFTSPSVQVSPGQQVGFTVENHLPISSVTVW